MLGKEQNVKFVPRSDVYRILNNDEMRDACLREMEEDDFIEEPQLETERRRDVMIERIELDKFMKNLHDHRYLNYYPKKPAYERFQQS